MPTEVVTRGIQGPAGPGSVSPGAVITSRGGLIVGNASAVPTQLLVGTNGQVLRSNGTDPVWSAIQAADLPAGIDAAKLSAGNVSNAEFDFLDGVTSAIQAQLDAKAATSHAHTSEASRGFYVDQNAISNATPSDNTSSTTTYAVAMQQAFTLPDGTWTIRARGGCLLKHSASGTTLMRVSIEGQDSTARSITDPNATYWTPLIDTDSYSGFVVSGGLPQLTVYVHFRPDASAPGTVYARNPWVVIFAFRTS